MVSLFALVLGLSVIYYFLAGRTTPSHVYQVTENIVSELRSYQKVANSVSRPVTYIPENRKHRHVMQKAREILVRAEDLNVIKGVEAGGIPEFPVRRVTPKAVREIVEKIFEETLKLRPFYGITGELPSAPLPGGKVPSDVYGNLARIGNMLESLGAPKQQTKDVYRIVLTVIRDLEIIAAKKKNNCRLMVEEVTPDKTPGDVYRLTYRMLIRLNALEVALNVDLYENLTPPQRKEGEIVPADVLDLMNNVLADVGAIKAAMAIAYPTVVAPEQLAKIPGDVYSAVSSADALIKCLS
ncbi:MAG: hypothetical protein IH994_00545 [Proteobacteria bacterium]|nr:hypothetical protein [Pseudomonadota bacterium]